MSKFISRWGHPKADDEGYLYVPGWIMANYHKFKDKDGKQVGLTAGEFQFMCQVMSFKYDSPNSTASPSIPTVAERMGIQPRTVQRIKDTLVEKGAMTVTEQAGKPNIYEFTGLVSQCYESSQKVSTPDNIVTPDKNVTPDDIVIPTPDKIVTPPLTKLSPEEEEVRNKKEEAEEKRSTSSHLAIDSEFAAVANAYHELCGTIGGFMSMTLKDAMQEYTADWVLSAIHEAQQSNGRSWKYVKAILHRWSKEGKVDKPETKEPLPDIELPPADVDEGVIVSEGKSA